jgi:hypothetical protein
MRHLPQNMQPTLPGMLAPDPLLEFLRTHRRQSIQRERKPRLTAAEKRLIEARRDPRQTSIFGQEHTDLLMSQK